MSGETWAEKRAELEVRWSGKGLSPMTGFEMAGAVRRDAEPDSDNIDNVDAYDRRNLLNLVSVLLDARLAAEQERDRAVKELRESLGLYARALEVEHPILRGPAHGPRGGERANPFSECHECALLNDFTNGRLPIRSFLDIATEEKV
jgi:hypothetical protein